MKQIGILGGSFNPITIGHLEMAFVVIKNTNIDEVWITPCYSHMQKNGFVAPEHRLEMCKIASNNLPSIRAFDYEIANRLSEGTYEFMARLMRDESFSGYNFSYIIGGDNLNIFTTWRRFEDLKKLVRFIVVPRQGVKLQSEYQWCKESPHILLNTSIMKVSSTSIRRLLKLRWMSMPLLSSWADRRLVGKIDGNVLGYILKNGLYR